jgi:hypothetical protein
MLRLWVDGIVILGSVTALAAQGAEVVTWCDGLCRGVTVVVGALPWINECGRAGFRQLTNGDFGQGSSVNF